ncbi:MAG TPA: nucleotide exchange factor GrpE [Candidatus Eisenbacteria bacterium]|jgi:molecular chaperone GrpE|nr:nucleotide exchange factor GrpE [Candidatus Eisenbacteria bacterium]
MKRKNEVEPTESVSPEGVEPAGDLGPETSVEAAEGSSLITEIERLRGREDELLRALAEQQNVVRRRRQEMESSLQYAQESLVKDLLPVLDDFERALKAMDGATNDSMRAGVALVYERLVRILTTQGLEPIRPLGEPFDPTLHDALAQDPAPGKAPGTVVEVAQPGYKFKGRVLRHAKVVVAGSTETSEGGI